MDIRKIKLNNAEYEVGVPVDETLTVSGAAADAAAVGELENAVGGLGDAFFCKKLCIEPNQKTRFYGDGTYCPNPAFESGSSSIYFYDANNTIMFMHDENGDPAPAAIQHGTLGAVALQNRQTMEFDGAKVTIRLYLGIRAFDANQPSNVYEYWFDEVPTYIRTNRTLSYEVLSTTQFSTNLYFTRYDVDKSRGLLDQINHVTEDADISALSTADEYARRFRTEAVRVNNRTRHALRVGTFNIARYGQEHWYKIKECLQNYGIDICGLQEVQYPQGGGAKGFTDKLSERFASWQFDSFSTHGSVGEFPDNGNYPNNVRSLMAGNGFKIESTVETFLERQGGYDYRYVAKSVVSLPRYKDKRGSENLKLSIYNTQLEVNNDVVAQAQAREILAMAQADPNPFVIIMGDTNDFTLNKGVWQIFEEGGFTPVVDTNTSTVAGTEDFQCLDNIFISSRIKAFDWNVVWAQDWPWTKVGVTQPMLSDHDLVFADLALDYSDIRCVNLSLTNCTVDWTKGWLTDKETVTFTITPDEGYQLPASPNQMRDCMLTNNDALSYSNGTVTIDGSKLIGDVFIKVVATK